VVGWGVGGCSLIQSELHVAIEEGQTGVHLDVLQGGIHGEHIGHEPRAQQRLELQRPEGGRGWEGQEEEGRVRHLCTTSRDLELVIARMRF
jgi:hypothetical protein